MRGAAPLINHDLVTNARLTIGNRLKFNNLRLFSMGLERNDTTFGFGQATRLALTGGWGEGQCPAPLAGPPNLADCRRVPK